MSWEVKTGDCVEVMRSMEPESVDCVVTSPPYWGLRDYGVADAWGLEPTLGEYLDRMRTLGQDLMRVLKPSGTLWLNMGDAYATPPTGSFNGGGFKDGSAQSGGRDMSGVATSGERDKVAGSGLPPKNLIGLPWRVAFAFQEIGWYLRSEIIWHKRSCMPESVKDRPTRSHEQIFLLTKSARYFYDADAISEPAGNYEGCRNPVTAIGIPGEHENRGRTNGTVGFSDGSRNARTVWDISTTPYPDAHFATFPQELPKRCILAGCPEGGLVLDPFAGSGTTLEVAVRLGRKAIGLELNPEYVRLIEKRMQTVTPSLFSE